MVTIQVSCQSVSDFYHTEGSEESVRPHNESNQSDSLFEKYLHSCDIVYIFVGRTDL